MSENKYNQEQTEAIEHTQGPALIVAGAGTGKTTVLVGRIEHLVKKGLAKPDEILALTFSEKAAGEMEERTDKLLPFGYFDLWISTFHGFGEKILRAHGLEIGLPGGFRLFNEFEQYSLMKRNLDKFDLDYYRPMGNPNKFISALLKHFSRAKDEDISAAEYLEYADGLRQNLDDMLGGVKGKNTVRLHSGQAKKQKSKKAKLEKLADLDEMLKVLNINGTDGGVDREMLVQEVGRINEVANAYHVYQQLLLDEAALDFGDLINYTLKLFRERKIVLEKYRRQFKYIMLDEFQDTNIAQYELVKLLASPQNNLVVVGDDDQSIYKFRGASVSNILQFQKDFPNSRQIFLNRNYRNRQEILDMSYEFIKLNNPNRLEWQLQSAKEITNSQIGTQIRNESQELESGDNEAKKQKSKKAMGITTAQIGAQIRNGFQGSQLSKKLIAQVPGRAVIEVLEGDTLDDEIRLVVEKIAELKIESQRATENNAQRTEDLWSDFAILVRANDGAKEFCNALELAGLPYQFLSSRGLYAKEVVMDVIAYLKLLDNYHESPAVFRVLNLPIFNFSYQEIVNFNYFAKKKAWSLFEVLKSFPNVSTQLKNKIDRVLKLVEDHTKLARFNNITELIIAFVNESGYLKYLMAQEGHKANESISYLNQFLKRAKTFEASSDDKRVRAFLHELNMEIEAGEQGSLPFDPDSGPDAIKVMTVHASKGLEFKYVFLVNMVDQRFPTIERKDPIALPDDLVKEVVPEGDIHIEEERRLFYVAATRAKDHLYFSWAPDYGGSRKKKPSRFLVEAGLVVSDESSKDKGQSSKDKVQRTNNIDKAIEITNSQIGAQIINGFRESEFDDNEAKKQKSKKANGITNSQIKAQIRNNFQESRIKNSPSTLAIPAYFSHTQLTAFKNCPYQYYFAHIVKVPTQGKFVFSFGRAMHLTLQKLFELVREKRGLGQGDLFGCVKPDESKVNISIDEVYEIYEKSWIDDWYDSKGEKEKYRQKGKEIIRDFFNKHKDNWPQVESLEQGVNLKIGGFRIFGKIDRIDCLADGRLQIVDYKTGQPKKQEDIEMEDKEQLLIYQMAIEQASTKKISNLQFYYLDNNSEINFLGTPKDIAKMEEKIITRINGIKEAASTGCFPAMPGPLCKYCDFNSICEFRKN